MRCDCSVAVYWRLATVIAFQLWVRFIGHCQAEAWDHHASWFVRLSVKHQYFHKVLASRGARLSVFDRCHQNTSELEWSMKMTEHHSSQICRKYVSVIYPWSCLPSVSCFTQLFCSWCCFFHQLLQVWLQDLIPDIAQNGETRLPMTLSSREVRVSLSL